MASIIKFASKKSFLQSIYDGLSTKSSRYFYFIGRTEAWDNETTPDTPIEFYNYELETRNNIVLVKQMSINDLSFVIRRINWTTETIYDMYDDSTSITDLNFYVMTDEFNVYKCIDNNNGVASTVKPTGSDVTSQTYADGYIWKFMYNIPVALRNKFMTVDYIPVLNALNNQFYSSGGIESVTVQSGGSGYTTATAVVSGNGASVGLTPVIENGEIISCTVDDPGYGYTYASIIVTGDGTGAELIPNLIFGDINSLQANIELQAINGSLEAIKVVSGGSNYTSATVTITGDGTGATATATLNSGVVTKIMMTAIGSGYTWATVTITGDGTGATATAIMSPKGGHGKNAINELFAKKLMFVSSLFNEKNHGLTIANEFRQTGIIRNMTGYGTQTRYKLLTGTSCFKITGIIDSTKFPKDSILYMSSNSKRFLVIESNTNVLLVQPLDNQLPINATTYRNAALDAFNATTITEPTIDKFSGEMISIDNRESFTVLEAQALTFRTVIEL